MFRVNYIGLCVVSYSAAYSLREFLDKKKLKISSILSEASCDGEAPKSQKILKFASVYFRHGTRTPLTIHPLFKDYKWPTHLVEPDQENLPIPHKIYDLETGIEGRPPSYYDGLHSGEILNGGCTSGKLTKKGRYDALNLGKKLKQRYMDEYHLLDNSYDYEDISCYSTNFDRTIESLVYVLKGYFGDTINEENFAKIYTRKNEVDYNFPNNHFCKSLGHWVNYVYQAQYAAPHCDKLLSKLKAIIPDEKNIPTPLKLNDGINSLKSNGMIIDEKFEDLYEILDKCASHVEKWAMYGEIPLHMKLSFGKVIDDIMSHMENTFRSEKLKIENRLVKFPKVHFTACHDTTILSLLTTMGGFNETWPKLACYLSFELFQDSLDNDFYVRIVFNDEVIVSGGTDENGFIELRKFLKKYDHVRMRESFIEYCNEI